MGLVSDPFVSNSVISSYCKICDVGSAYKVFDEISQRDCIPYSTLTSPGLDMLKHAKHFYFNKNKLAGPIPSQVFDEDMVLIHVLFDGNQLSRRIPSRIGSMKTLEALYVKY
nr:probable leucine-rich repeat receptor-like protein kinase At5g49770 [Tanacetum cinerariifolium]